MGAKTFPPAGIRTTDLPNSDPQHLQLRHQNPILDVLQPIYIRNKLYFGVRAIGITQK